MELGTLYGDGPGLDTPGEEVALGALQTVVGIIQSGDPGGVVPGIRCFRTFVAGAADTVAGDSVGHIGADPLLPAIIDQRLAVIPGYLGGEGIDDAVIYEVILRCLVVFSVFSQVIADDYCLAEAGVFVIIAGQGLDGDAAIILRTEAGH